MRSQTAETPTSPARRLMSAIEIDAKRLGPEYWGAMQDIERVCPLCPETSRCRTALAAGNVPVQYSTFCPNADVLAEMEAASAGALVGDRA